MSEERPPNRRKTNDVLNSVHFFGENFLTDYYEEEHKARKAEEVYRNLTQFANDKLENSSSSGVMKLILPIIGIGCIISAFAMMSVLNPLNLTLFVVSGLLNFLLFFVLIGFNRAITTLQWLYGLQRVKHMLLVEGFADTLSANHVDDDVDMIVENSLDKMNKTKYNLMNGKGIDGNLDSSSKTTTKINDNNEEK